ncbi:MAG: DVUA0089 family protein, partial [Myxococcales bacterium]|nr:DVUA0089 family protein [Myxococcales bacterium]
DTPCEDGAYCTVDDVCEAGECQPGGPRDCGGGSTDPCLVPSCDEDLDACDSSSAPNGTACTSTDVCLTNTICLNGACTGAPLDCSGTPLDSPECQQAACDPATGQCVIGPVNDGDPCTFGDICESDKVCDAGECLGTPIPNCTGCTETEPNETFAAPNSGVGCVSWAGGITVVGDHDCFAVEVTTAGSRIAAEVVDVGGVTNTCPSGFDPYLRLFSSTGTQLATDDDGGMGLCSLFGPTTGGANNLPVGTYSVCVEELGNNATSPPYVLLLSVIAPVPPGCGNNVVEYGEDCDGSAGCTACEFACTAGQVPFSVDGTGLPIAITDLATFTSTANVATTGTIASVGVQVNINHTYDGDLHLNLISPMATNVDLSSENGGTDENYINTVFSTNGTTNITAGTAPYTGVFLPEGNLALFNGQTAAGNWTLSVQDDANGDQGTLNQWRVFGCINP